MTSPSTILRAIRQTSGPQCTHCGSFSIYPDPNPLVALAGFVHLSHWFCRECATGFWVREGLGPLWSRTAESGPDDEACADEEMAEAPAPMVEGACGHDEPLVDTALDAAVAAESACDADLSALDAEFARLSDPSRSTRPRRRRKRPRAN